jgi:hypothetical protein
LLAADPDKYNSMVYELEDLNHRHDVLRAELAIAQTSLDNQTSSVSHCAQSLAKIKDRLAILPACAVQSIGEAIGGIQRDIDAVITALKEDTQP